MNDKHDPMLELLKKVDDNLQKQLDILNEIKDMVKKCEI